MFPIVCYISNIGNKIKFFFFCDAITVSTETVSHFSTFRAFFPRLSVGGSKKNRIVSDEMRTQTWRRKDARSDAGARRSDHQCQPCNTSTLTLCTIVIHSSTVQRSTVLIIFPLLLANKSWAPPRKTKRNGTW